MVLSLCHSSFQTFPNIFSVTTVTVKESEADLEEQILCLSKSQEEQTFLKYKCEQCHYTSDKISNLKCHISLNHNEDELACLIVVCYKKVLTIWNAARENSFF